MDDHAEGGPHGSLPVRRRRRLGRSCIVCVAALVLGIPGVAQLTGSGRSSALGAVIAVTPDLTAPPVILGYEPDVSDRGELVAAMDVELSTVVAVDRAAGAPGVPVPGSNIAVSGNGCVSAHLQRSDGGFDVVRRATCGSVPSGTIATISANEGPFSQLAVDHDGDVVVVPTRQFVRVYDTTSGIAATVPPPPGTVPAQLVDGDATEVETNSVDVDDAGDVVVATFMTQPVANPPVGPPILVPPIAIPPIAIPFPDFPPIVIIPTPGPPIVNLQPSAAVVAQPAPPPSAFVVATWAVGAGGSQVVSTLDGSVTGTSLHPSISGDGAFVSFVSSLALQGEGSGGQGLRAWVRPTAQPQFVPVSPPDRSALYTSLSADGSQIAYVTRQPSCSALAAIPNCVPNPFDNVVVAWSTVPGFAGPLASEAVNIGPAGVSGRHREPVLSGSGRYVTWQTNGGAVLLDRPFPDATHTMLRARDASMSVNSVDVGAVQAGGSASGVATVTNTGVSSIKLGAVDVDAPGFSNDGTGSCNFDNWMPPNASCTVGLRFDAPLGGGAFGGEIVVREVGFEPVQATGLVTGVSTTTTTTTTTTPPGGSTTTTTLPTTTSVPVTTTTVTTIPGVVDLSAEPDPLDFGDVAVGIPTAPDDVVITNDGTARGTPSVSIGGADGDDFEIVDDGCSGSPLLAGASCTVSIRLTASDGGPRTATLTIAVPAAGGVAATSLDVELLGSATFQPRLVASPDVIEENGITTIVGQGFPFGRPVSIEIGDGVSFTVDADDAGMFSRFFESIDRLPLGMYDVVALPAAGLFDEVDTPLIVALPTFQPHGPTGPAFGNNLLVNRG